jgi:hypothetical protein
MSNELEQIKNIMIHLRTASHAYMSGDNKQGDYESNYAEEQLKSLLSEQKRQHTMILAGVEAAADQRLTVYRADLLEKVSGLETTYTKYDGSKENQWLRKYEVLTLIKSRK